MELTELLNGINLKQSVKERVLSEAKFFPPLTAFTDRILRGDGAEHANNEIKKLLHPDADGMKILAVHLTCALGTYEKYRALGIDDSIFYATIGCFSRFLEESVRNKGKALFDRDWWTIRQLSCTLFRLGELEYEITKDGRVSIHIPSDCDMRDEQVDLSLKKAKFFFKKFFPNVSCDRFYCTSWLLSPNLRKILPANSRILSFSQRFVLTDFMPEDVGFYFWVYGKEECAVEDLPQNTSLQKNLKQFLKAGNRLGAASGYILCP